jgi:TRAP-type C4-dicarboxylate transport system permease small subunit
MKRLIRVLDDYFEEYFLVCTLSFSVLLIFAQVMMRYIFRNSVFWSEELARYLFIWQAWVASSFATKHSRHINLDVVVNLCPSNVKKVLFWVAHVIWLSFTLYLTWRSAGLTSMIFSRRTVSAAMQIRMGWVYLAVPFGSAMMSFRLVQIMVSKLREQREGVA